MLRRERCTEMHIEEGACCKGSVGVLRRMYELGVRMMTLTWNHEDELASPTAEPRRGAGAPDRKGPDREGL